MIIVLWVFVVQLLLVAAYPTGQYDGDSETVYIDDILEQVPVQGVAEFNGTVPVSGSVTIVGGSGCPPLQSTSEPSPILPENDDYDETLTLSELTQIGLGTEDSDKTDGFSESALIGSLLVDSILAGREAEMEAKFAQIDAFVESELAKTDSMVNSVLAGVDAAVISDLQQLESENEIKLENNIEDTIECELTKTERPVEFTLENNETPLKLNLVENKLETPKLKQLELLVESELAKVNSFVESELKKTEAKIESELKKVGLFVETELAINEALVKSELEKVDSFVDSEMAKTEALIQSELAKVNSIVESELAKTETLIESELRKLDLFVESELEKVDSIVDSESTMLEVPVAGVAEFQGVVPASGRAIIYGSTGCNLSSIFPIIEENAAEIDPEKIELPNIDNVELSETVPVTGRTMIFGNTGYLEPNLGPLETNLFNETEEFCENIPVTDQVSITGRSDCAPLLDSVKNILEALVFYNDSLAEPIDTDDDILEAVPVVGEAVFSGVTPASGHVKIVRSAGCPLLFPLNPPTVGNAAPFIQSQNAPNTEGDKSLWLELERKENAQNIPDTEGVLSQINVLPIVNVFKKQTIITGDGHPKEIAIIEGNLEVNGTARATGRTILVTKFECAPLMPTAETTDGKKWLWLAKESSSKGIPAPVSQAAMIEFPISQYPTDFPETVIMDATKNYERLLDDYGEDSYEEAIPVAGEVYFEGVTPAFGSVSIRGHSA